MSQEEAERAARWTLAVRAGVGFVQGLALYALHHWRNHIDPIEFGALTTAAWLVPIVFLGAFGALRLRTLVLWTIAAVAIAGGLGGYAAFARAGEPTMWEPALMPAVIFIAATLYILHHLILPAAAERRWRAGYERYFDEAWMDAVRLALSALFVGLLWGLLWLGASLFKLIGLSFLQDLIEKGWFAFPATTTFFAFGVHLTDVRVTLVRGARILLLTLLSWLLTVLTVIAVAFLAAIPFTGLKALSAAGSASGTMLAVCAALVVLINATYQEGEQDGYPPIVLKWFSRIAALALVPLVGVAFYGLGLRIGQYGLTPQRINMAACLLVAACYAAGYAWAAIRRGRWLAPLEWANWVTAQVMVGLMLALFSPLADPMRLSVSSQVRRLEVGAVAPAQFDFAFLRFHAGRWGLEALQRLASTGGSPRASDIASLAKTAQGSKNPWDRPAIETAERARRLRPLNGSVLPVGFLDRAWNDQDDPANDCSDQKPCPVLVADIDGQPGPEVIVFNGSFANVYDHRQAGWRLAGTLNGPLCSDDQQAVAEGDVRTTPSPPHNDVIIGQRRFVLQETHACGPVGGPAGIHRR
jgi:hypothetical protein